MKRKIIDEIREGLCKTILIASLLCFGTALWAQKTVTGTVSDENGTLSGATVMVKGTNVGVLTGGDGTYSVNVPSGNVTLVFSLMGFATREVTVGGRTVIDVRLTEEAEEIDEVVVVGYGTQKKVNLSGSVSAISGKALENRPVTNANHALQGLAPNMTIANTSGNPTFAPDINIRGFTSINGGSALILLDNVPVSADELSRINPSDIESVSVLKDASSAAIYGARAAFGVVLVTSRRARNSKLEIDADINIGVRQFIELPETLTDTYWFMRLQNESANDPNRFPAEALEYAKRRMANPSLPEILYPSDGLNPRLSSAGRWEYYGSYNYYDIALNSLATTQNYNVRVAQRTDRLSYIVSGGYYQQNSLIKYEEPYTRYNFRGNGTYRMTDWWQLGSSVSFARSNFNTPYFTDDNRNENFFYHLQSKYTTQPIYNPDGTWTQDGGGTVVGIPRDGGRRIKGTNETRLAFDTQMDILKDVWFVRGDINFVFHNTAISHNEIPVYYRNGPGLSPSTTWGPSVSSIQEEANTMRRSVVNVYTDFHKTFGDKHFVQALAGFSQEEYRSENMWVKAEGLISESYPTLALTTGAISKGKGVNVLALRGWFGRLNYIYDNRYIIEFNGRRDASSRFPQGSRWGFFPSASAAWVVSNEKFLEPAMNFLAVNNLKLRGSYGSLGNQSIKDNNGNEIYYPFYPSMGTTSQIGPVLAGSRPMSVNAPGTPAAGDLTWEKVRSVNFGIDLSLLQNRFDVSFDKYTRYTEGMLTLSKELPAVFGASPPRTNAADLETQGWDLSVGWRDKFDLAGSPFNYSVRVMISDSRAKITKFDNPDRRYNDWYVGKEPGEIWGFVTAGFFNTEEDIANWHDQTAVSSGSHGNRPYLGDVKYMNLDGDKHVNTEGKPQINRGSETVDDPGDRKIIGNSSIHLPYSFDIGADWKGFDFRAFFQGVGKREVYPDGVFFFGMHSGRWTNPVVKELDYWGVPEDFNPNAYFPRLTNSPRIAGAWNAQTKYLQNAAYLRLKNLTLGYTIPRELTERWKISRLRVFFSGENLLTFDHFDVSGIDPETANHGSSTTTSYFPQKIYSFGLNLSF